MKATLLSGLAAVALAGYGVYDSTRPAAAAPDAAAAVAEDLAKIPEINAKAPGDLAKFPEANAKNPGDLGTILD